MGKRRFVVTEIEEEPNPNYTPAIIVIVIIALIVTFKKQIASFFSALFLVLLYILIGGLVIYLLYIIFNKLNNREWKEKPTLNGENLSKSKEIQYNVPENEITELNNFRENPIRLEKNNTKKKAKFILVGKSHKIVFEGDIPMEVIYDISSVLGWTKTSLNKNMDRENKALLGINSSKLELVYDILDNHNIHYKKVK